MTRDEFLKDCIDILLGQEFVPGVPLFECDDIDDFIIGNDGCEMVLSEFLDLIYDDLEMEESKREQEIREELNHLSTYRVTNSTTDLVSLKAVERVLNLVFRGYRDKDPKSGSEEYDDPC